MKYEAEINGRAIELDFEERESLVRVVIGDEIYEARVARPADGAFLFFMGDSVYEARVSTTGERGLMGVNLAGETFSVRVIDRKHRPVGGEHSGDGQQMLTAPMPGKVVKVLSKVGDSVKAGQGIVVVEAMKMQNEIKSPRAGIVADIRVTEGLAVNANQVLAVVE